MFSGCLKWCCVVAVGWSAVCFAQEPALDAGVVAVEVAAPPPAADPTFFDRHFHGTRVLVGTSHYEVGFIYGQGGLLFADGVAPIPLQGVVLKERNGILSYLLTVFTGQALSAYAIANSAVQISDVRTKSSTSTRYHADGSKTLVTTRTTTATVTQLKTQAQVDRETETANKDISSGLVGHTFADLAIYADLPGLTGGQPAGAGYEFTFGGQGELFTLMDLPVVLDLGVHLANVRVKTPTSPGLGGPFLFHSAGGVLARLHVPLTRFAAVSVEWVLNFLSIGYLIEPEDLLAKGSRPLSPLRLKLDVFLTDYAFVRGEMNFGVLGVSDGRLGFSLTAGVRL